MKTRIALTILSILLAAPAFAQQWVARRIIYGATLPAVCNQNAGEVFVRTGAPAGLFRCTAANTWLPFTSGPLAGGTTNRVAKFTGSYAVGDSSIVDDGTQVYTTEFIGAGLAAPTAPLHSYRADAVTAASYGIRIQNLQTNATTDGISKYALHIASTGNFPGLGGGVTYNYGLYAEEPTGADVNVGAAFLGRVGVGTAIPTILTQFHVARDATEATTTQVGIYIDNLRLNSTTDGISKYGMYVNSTGNFVGIGGAATNNYGIYIDATTGADNNVPLYVTGAIQQSAVLAAALGTPANGTWIYCSDCTIANPCAGGGTGALAKRLNGAWVCN